MLHRSLPKRGWKPQDVNYTILDYQTPMYYAVDITDYFRLYQNPIYYKVNRPYSIRPNRAHKSLYVCFVLSIRGPSCACPATRSLLFGAYVRAPDFWKLRYDEMLSPCYLDRSSSYVPSKISSPTNRKGLYAAHVRVLVPNTIPGLFLGIRLLQ